MPKKFSCLLLTLAILLSLTACGDNAGDPNTTDPSQTNPSVTTPVPSANDTLVGFGGGASGGGFYTFSNILSLALTDAGIGKFSAQATTGGKIGRAHV